MKYLMSCLFGLTLVSLSLFADEDYRDQAEYRSGVFYSGEMTETSRGGNFLPYYANQFQNSAYGYADDCCCNQQNSWDLWLYPNYLYLGNTVGKGIGYDRGYATIGAFLMPDFVQMSRFKTFVDVAGHCFSHGKWAANVGVGTRYLLPCSDFVIGANLYYDYRRLHRHDLNQIGFGLEFLGPDYDVRFNAYFPVGDSDSVKGRLYDFGDGFYAIRHKRNSAWEGFDLEVGAWLTRKSACDWFGLYFAAGPYYYSRDKHHHFDDRRDTWGARARLLARIWDFVDVSVIGTYDEIWHTRVQGQITVAIPFDYCGSFFKDAPNTCCNRCTATPCLQNQIAMQPVQRNGIIVGDEDCRWKWNWSDGCDCRCTDSRSSDPCSESISLSHWSSICHPSYSYNCDCVR